ncbi:MAG: hypothetical protein JWL81_1597 [Verrucomicrobiales bacterium]|nr:hypothetical protein [Verrucomicrobiales bacterium]
MHSNRSIFATHGLGGIPTAFGRACGAILLIAAFLTTPFPTHAEDAAAPPLNTSLRVGYLAEVPVSWRTGFSDPLRTISRSLATGFARPVDPELPFFTENLIGAESWEDLSRDIQLGNAELFPLHGYEFVEQEDTLPLKALLLATRPKGWQTRFVILCTKSSGLTKLGDLEGRKILIHRDGCGNLVDYWLDSAIAIGTGKNRKGFARYETVTQPREAVLPVFFGEADACVVSLAAYESVAMQNHLQITQKMAPFLAESKDLPGQVIACKSSLSAQNLAYVRAKAATLTWEYGEETGGFIVAEELAFDNLRDLLHTRNNPSGTPAPVSPTPPSAKLQTSAPPKPAVLPKSPARPARP